MRILFASDLHIDSHGDFSYQLPSGIDNRLCDCLDVIDKIRIYAEKYRVRAVVLGGDIFHTPCSVETVAFQEAFKRFEQLADSIPKLVVNVGNHDLGSLNELRATYLYPFRNLNNTEVALKGYLMVALDDIVLHVIPYFRDHSKLISAVEEAKTERDRKDLLVTHCGISEAPNGPNEIKLKSDVSIRSQAFQKFDYWFAGHHHHPARLNSKAVVIGAPLQMNMNDRGDRRGLLIYDTKKDTVKRIWLRGSRFFKVEIDRFKDYEKLQRMTDAGEYDGGYVRVLLTQGVIAETKVMELLINRTKMYKVQTVKAIQNTARNEAITTKAMANVGNLSVVVKDYVEHIRPAHLKPKRLISIGKRLIQPQTKANP